MFYFILSNRFTPDSHFEEHVLNYENVIDVEHDSSQFRQSLRNVVKEGTKSSDNVPFSILIAENCPQFLEVKIKNKKI